VVIAESPSDEESTPHISPRRRVSPDLQVDVEFISAALDHFAEITAQVLQEHAEHCHAHLVRQTAQLQLTDFSHQQQASQYSYPAYHAAIYHTQTYPYYVQEEA
jgi:hypothetical protein